MILKPHSALWTKIRIGRCRQSFESKRTVMVVVLSFWIGMTCLPARHTRAQPQRRSLAGTWAFRLDPQDIGAQQRWFDEDLTQPIQLPGSMQAQGFGDDVTVDTEWTGDIIDKSWFTDPKYEQFRQPGNVKVPFWLQPEKHYVGAAWYQRTVKIPEDWQGKRLTLHLERCHWETTVWVDGRRIGAAKSLSTPHLYDLSQGPRPRRITIRVDNRVKVNVGPNAHSISDHTQSNWNGIVGRIELAATDRVWVDDVRVYPNIDQKLAKLKIAIGNLTGSGGRGELRVQAEAYNSHAPAPCRWDDDSYRDSYG